MHVAIFTFEGFNELDSFIALGILNRVRKPGWRVSIACPRPRVRSMNGVVVEAQASLEEAGEADAVIVGSGVQTRQVVADQPLFARGNVATAGGCLGSAYLAAWMIARLEGVEAAERALHYVAPVGEKEEYVARAMRHVSAYALEGLPLPKEAGTEVR